ncbi:MAG: helix-turn-helix domain-containing protein [Sedimentisphaerales bacterium]|jgi:excisionase family DNA binding protein
MDKIRSNWLTIPEAAEYLRCGERFLRELVASRRIPHVLFAGKVLFCTDSLDTWLLEQEINASSQKDSRTDRRHIPEDMRKIKTDCQRDQVENQIAELLNYKKGKERWVNGLGKNLSKDLAEQDYRELSEPVYAQLSRWCHPLKPSPRNNWVQTRAKKIAELLFGRDIDRGTYPSYRS